MRRDALLALCLFALGLLVSHWTRERSFEGRLNSDEPEWIAISILHWRQLALGEPPAGAELDTVDSRRESEWAQGVQRTTFGYMNPCLPKLLWGAVLHARGFREASPLAFQTFNRAQPNAGKAAQQALLPAEGTARAVVVSASVASAVLLFFVARGLARGLAGWCAATLAYGSWFATPLVQNTAGYLRTDHFMLPMCLAGLLLALARPKVTWGWGAALGLLCGLAVSSKLNGGLLCLATAAWALLALARDRTRARHVLGSVALAAAVSWIVFVALNPRLWDGALDGVRDILARWDKLLVYFQDELAPRTNVAVARTLPERAALFARALPRSVPGGGVGVALAALGAVVLGVRSCRGSEVDRARAAAVFVAVFIAGTLAWLPIDWERFYLTATPALILLAVLPFGALVERLATSAPNS